MHKHSVAYLQKAIATFAKITPITNTSQQVKELTTTQNNIEEKESIDNNKIKCEDIKRNIEGIIDFAMDRTNIGKYSKTMFLGKTCEILF